MLRLASISPLRILTQCIGALAMLTLFGTQSAFAEIKITENSIGSGRYDVFITGTITAQDAADLERHEPRLSYFPPTVLLESPGGEVDAAMRVGRILRRLEARTQIYPKWACLSSCTLIYIAGVDRLGLGTLGIHRPYLASNATRRDSVANTTRTMLSSVEIYVREMGVSPIFFDLMVQTEPSRMKVFKGQEIDSLIPQKDPVYDEIEINYDARKYGIPKVEMRRRQSEASTRCQGPWALGCERAIYWGLSEGVYERRLMRVDLCFSDDATKGLDQVLWRLRRDHAIYIKVEDCIRKAMTTD